METASSGGVVVLTTAALVGASYAFTLPTSRPDFEGAPSRERMLLGLAAIEASGDTRDMLVARQAQHSEMLGGVRLNYKGNTVRGVLFPPFVTEGSLKKLQSEFHCRQGDVFVTTYPKCGTTWMQNIVALLKHGADETHDTTNAVDTQSETPWVEPIFARPGGAELLESLASPRVFKTHAPHQLMPFVGGATSTLPAGSKVVYVARNPKDACVSMFHHARAIPVFQYEGPFGHWVEMYLRGEVEHGSWWAHTLDWWQASRRQPEQVLFITYEEMVADPVAAVRRVCSFLGEGWQRSDQYLQRVARDSNFSLMKAAAEERLRKGGNAVGPGQTNRKAGEESHFRVGGVGGWRDYLTVAQSDRFDEQWARLMAKCKWVPHYGE
jgi:hypothetical protein